MTFPHGPRIPAVFLVCAFLLSPAMASADRTTEEARQVSKTGAHDLALALLAQHPPNPRTEIDRWAEYERTRIDILMAAGRHQDVTALKPPFWMTPPEGFLPWLHTRQAEAWLALKDGTKVRALLRPLLWVGEPAESEVQRKWRLVIAESYRVDGLASDARIAYLRYRQDYPEAAMDVVIPQARALLSLGEATEVSYLLKGVEGHEARALSLLARLRAGEALPAEIMREADTRAGIKGLAANDVARYRFVAAEAAAGAHDVRGHAEYVAKLLVAQRRGADAQFALDGDALWGAWLELGRETANTRQLLIGDDNGLLAAAEQLEFENDALARTALLALVAIEGVDEEARRLAHAQLTARVAERPDGKALLQSLYLDAPRHAPAEAPVAIRRLRAQAAINDGDFAGAAALLADIAEPPEDQDAYAWQLMRARAFILGERVEAGVAVLRDLLDGIRSFEPAAADRFLQAVFDLQALGQHAAAASLLTAIEPRLTDDRQRREILYWQADSQRELGNHVAAARLYLHSALSIDNGLDQWGQGARFQAAEALVRAGFIVDARRQYEILLAATESPVQRSMLRGKLQELTIKR